MSEFSYKYTVDYNYVLMKDHTHVLRFGIKALKNPNSIEAFVTVNKVGEEVSEIVIKKGYAWDGVTCFFDWACLFRAALVHDTLYQMVRVDILDESYLNEADREFRRVAIADGSTWLLGWLAYLVVHWIGRLWFSKKQHHRSYALVFSGGGKLAHKVPR